MHRLIYLERINWVDAIDTPHKNAHGKNTKKSKSEGIGQGKRQFDLFANSSLQFVSLIDSENQILQSASLTTPGTNVFIGKKHDGQKNKQGNHSRGEDGMGGAVKVNGVLHGTHWVGI